MSKTIDVDRMRRAQERRLEAAAGQDERRWLAAMTPEHREVHLRGPVCGECISEIGRNLQRSLEALRVGLKRDDASPPALISGWTSGPDGILR